MKKKIHKIIAVYLALNLLFEIISPTVALALTNGPSQPEMESFEPIGTTEMVDPFSGDFNYNIPLMTVPGPNGGYPINLAYHAGIGMEQEASWVGLGWNINAGEINRQLRGLPDDFDGDLIGKVMYMRPNRTVSVGGTATMEIVSADLDKYGLSGSLNLIWNNYKGIGFGMGAGIAQKSNGNSNGFLGGLNGNYSSMSGEMTLSPSLSYSKMQKDKENVFGLSFSYGSVEGAKQLDFSHSKTEKAEFLNSDLEMETYSHTSAHTAGVSFSSTSYIPHSEMPMSGFSVGAEFQWGADIAYVNPYISVSANYTQNKISQNVIALKGYGYLNSQKRNASYSGQELSLMDFNREKDVDLVKDIPSLPVPVFTNDIFFAKGQGVGGAFRLYRSDVGVLHDPVITSKNIGGNLSVELATGNPMKVGADITVSYSKGYQGPWRDPDTWKDLHNNYQFKDPNAATPLFEPGYFRNAGDMTANEDESATTIQGSSAAFPIKFQFGLNNLVENASEEIGQPLANIQVSNPGYISQQQLTVRPSRSQSMSYKTFGQLKTPGSASKFSENTIIRSFGDFPRNAEYIDSPPYTTHPSSHIGEVSVINPDGNRYIYGLAAYNQSTVETSFSVTGNTTNPADENYVENGKLVDYTVKDASLNNEKNDDHFYTFKSMPEYAHSYLLTAIVSPDYVDLTDNGLTDDDYGYYVKFNYTKLNGGYMWRSPFTKASYMGGFNSIKSDDKAGFVYGSKEIWYLNSVETKTHIAEFKLSSRKDGFGANNSNNGAIASNNVGNIRGSVALQKIDRIDLYSKNDPNYPEASSHNPTPIKTVHFDYTYDLCGQVDNNNKQSEGCNYYTSIDRNANHGKLTLKKVWFTYLNNKKGQLSPYEFDYAERNPTNNLIDPLNNPSFSTMQMDRWGNYKYDALYAQNGGFNAEDPYVDQSSDATSNSERNVNSSVWCLKNILLPSGGKIKVEYESDDYAYLQDKPAMQMAKILATAKKDGPTLIPSSGNESGKITGDYIYIFFELERQPTSGELSAPEAQRNIIKPYVENITDLYFKTYQNLKKYYATAGMARDYVNGYAKVAGSGTGGAFTDDDAGINYGFETYEGNVVGFVKLAYVNVHDSQLLAGLDHTNPLRKAGWQYLKLNRTDLLYPSSTNNNDAPPGAAELLQLANGVIGYYKSHVQLFAGYYNYCAINGYCKRIDITPDHPSFLRVNSPDAKQGGGHRVKSIRIEDTWAESDDPTTGPSEGETISEYGQEYFYRMPDGTSSGVAEYEPMIGGDEISLRKPVRYSSDYFIVKHDNLYMEEPYCESYYPAASVGYSRVIIKGINHTDNVSNNVTKGVQGLTVNEYYTAKDFPLLATPSELLHKKFTPDLNIPFIGNVSFENHGFSQTYTVETNDMHGKPKSVATYSYGSNLTSTAVIPPTPVSKTEYIYNTDAEYSSSTRNHLNNQVDVLYADAYHKTSNIGLTKEFFIDMRERSNVSLSGGVQVNLELAWFPPIPSFAGFLAIDYAEALSKSVVGMNIISRNGVLMETREYSEGAMASTKNLMFDAATGKPLLTQVTNNFDAPVYTYNYAAHWAHDGMGAAYKNVGAVFSVSVSGTSCSLSVGDPTNYLSLGDEVSIYANNATDKYWVTDISSTGFTLRDKDNNVPSGSGGFMTIMRSGRRNQLSVSDGKIVSLSNPVSSRSFPLFDAWNHLNNNAPPPDLNTSYTFSYTDCSGKVIEATSSFGQTGLGGVPTNLYNYFFGFSLSSGKCGAPRFQFSAPLDPTKSYQFSKAGDKVFAMTGGVSIEGKCVYDCECLNECMPDVLHADAMEFKDDWVNAIDLIQQDVFNNQNIIPVPTPFTNAYASGKKGIWRALKTNVYQTDRKRDAVTDIAKNGTYRNFVLFDWNVGLTNPNWTWTSEVTKYNPYGYEIENKDPLSIYSAALYGYDNSVQTAIAHNASYYETAFEGFEDYKNNNYITGHGHLSLSFIGENTVGGIGGNAHTGKKSMTIEDGEYRLTAGSATYFTPTVGKKYLLSAWFNSGSGTPSVSFTNAITSSTTVGPVIEGWQKYDVVFAPSSTSFTTTFSITGGNGIFKIDDIRIQPFLSTLKTFVYDPQTLWLVAELDNQNYATFYNYDQEGKLVQVKKETIRGVATIKTTRSNTSRRANNFIDCGTTAGGGGGTPVGDGNQIK